MSKPIDLITLTKFTFCRNGQPLLTDLTFTLRSGECWAVVGSTGSGKTTLLQALAGQLPVSPGMIARQQVAAFVAFKEESRQFSYSGHFYQQRYHATMSDTHDGRPAILLRDYLCLSGSVDETVLIRRLGLEPLLDSSFIKLSNGQTRKARIGKALLQHPSILLLDNPFVGLDTSFRAELTNWLGDLVQHGLTLMIVAEPNNLPPFVTHVAELTQGQLRWAGSKQEFVSPSLTNVDPPLIAFQTYPKPIDFSEAFRLTDVTVRYGDKIILNAINWTVQAGERWALMGPNGAGKSVLLSLLYGDHPQAYANEVRVFGHRRGRGESIWDVKRRIGFVSPELHLYFPNHLTVRQVALTGLTDTLTVPNRVPVEAETDLDTLLVYFNVQPLQSRPFGTLSVGEQRLILFIRALLKNPPVLILDEPFQGLDARNIRLAQRLLDTLTNKTLLFVTHDRHELPNSIDRIFELN